MITGPFQGLEACQTALTSTLGLKIRLMSICVAHANLGKSNTGHGVWFDRDSKDSVKGARWHSFIRLWTPLGFTHVLWQMLSLFPCLRPVIWRKRQNITCIKHYKNSWSKAVAQLNQDLWNRLAASLLTVQCLFFFSEAWFRCFPNFLAIRQDRTSSWRINHHAKMDSVCYCIGYSKANSWLYDTSNCFSIMFSAFKMLVQHHCYLFFFLLTFLTSLLFSGRLKNNSKQRQF